MFLFSCGNKTEDKKGTPKRPSFKVDGYVIKTESFSETIEVPGSIVANEVTEIHPEVSGRIVNLYLREGQFVSKGAIIAKIYDGDLQAQLKKSQAQLGIAKANEERAAKLLEIQGISKQDYDAALLNVKNIEADIDITKTQIALTEVRAPFNGKMGLKDISPGAYVTPATVIAVINQTSTLKIDFTVPEKYTSKIKNGQEVIFSVEGNNREYMARVTATESNIDATSRSLTVRAVINKGSESLVPGAFAKVKIVFPPNPNTIFVPSNAVIATGKNNQIIVSVNGKANFSNVATGLRESSRVEITQGLKTGDTILVTGIMATKQNDKINFGKIM
jgi:membrane fusion protein (multidrug efflux system)